jgi:hypothetical protein
MEEQKSSMQINSTRSYQFKRPSVLWPSHRSSVLKYWFAKLFDCMLFHVFSPVEQGEQSIGSAKLHDHHLTSKHNPCLPPTYNLFFATITSFFRQQQQLLLSATTSLWYQHLAAVIHILSSAYRSIKVDFRHLLLTSRIDFCNLISPMHTTFGPQPIPVPWYKT